MNVAAWRRANGRRRILLRLTHPWPLYKGVGGISAIVNRADGSTEDLGRIATTYIRRGGWKVSAK